MYRRRGSADYTEETPSSSKSKSKVSKISSKSQSQNQNQSQNNGNCKNLNQTHNNNKKGTFRKSASMEPSSVSVSSSSSSKSHLRKKSFTSFWSNLFSTKIPENRNSGISTQSSSFESVNTILSTNSFSFVSPKRYKGKGKGKRIPVATDDGPMKPRRKISTLTRIGMKMGLKSKYNLQSCESLHHLSYLDSGSTCSSNSNTGTLNLNTLMRKKRRAPAPPPISPLAIQQQEDQEDQDELLSTSTLTPSAAAAVAAAIEPQPCCSKSVVPSKIQNVAKTKTSTNTSSTPNPCDNKKDKDKNKNSNDLELHDVSPKPYKIETFKITAHKRSSSEGQSENHIPKPSNQYSSSTLTNTYRSKSHVRGKRKAPVPPNPFGDPDAPEDTEEGNRDKHRDRDRDRLVSTSCTSPTTSTSNAPISSSAQSVSVPKSTVATPPAVEPGSHTSGSNSTNCGNTNRGTDTPLAGFVSCSKSKPNSFSSGISSAQTNSSSNDSSNASPKPDISATSSATATASGTHQSNHVNAEVTVMATGSVNDHANGDNEPINQIQTDVAMASAASASAPAATILSPEQEEEIAQNILNDKQEQQRSAEQQQQQQQLINQNNTHQHQTRLEADNRPGPSRQRVHGNEFSISPSLPLTPTDEDRQRAQKELDVLIAVSSQPRNRDSIDEQTQLQLAQLKREADKSPLMFLRPKSTNGMNSNSPTSSSAAAHKNQTQFNFNFNFHGANNGSGSNSSSPHNGHNSNGEGGRLSSTFITPPASPNSPFEEPLSPSSSASSNSAQYPPGSSSSPTSTTSSGKITPRPWYKRSSSSSSSKKTKQLIKPLATMTKFSDIDREASRIVEENRRRSAEKAYNETARELITMFNAFNKTQITGTGTENAGAMNEDDAENTANETSEHGKSSAQTPRTAKQPQQQVGTGAGSSTGESSNSPGNSNVTSAVKANSTSFSPTPSTSSTTATVAGTSGNSMRDKTGVSTALPVSTGNSKVTITNNFNNTNNGSKESKPANSSANSSSSETRTTVATTSTSGVNAEEFSKKLAIVQPQSNSRPTTTTAIATATGTGTETEASPLKAQNSKSEAKSATSTSATVANGISNIPAVGKMSSSVTTPVASSAATVLSSPNSSVSSIFSRQKQDWACSRCTLKNPHWRSSCEACYFKSESSVQKLSSVFDNNSIATSTPPVPSTFIPANGKLNPNPANPPKTQLTGGTSSGLSSSSTGMATSSSSASSTLTNKVLPTPKIEGNSNASASTSARSTAAKETKGQESLNSKNLPATSATAIPPCENFLSQLPVKETLAREEKLVGMKLDEDPSEELDIIRLREARLAFFNKTTTTATGSSEANKHKTDDNTNTPGFTSSTSASNRSTSYLQLQPTDTVSTIAPTPATVGQDTSEPDYASNCNSNSTIQSQPKSNNLAGDDHHKEQGAERNRKQPAEKKELNVFSDDEDDSIDALLQIPNFKSPFSNNVNVSNGFNRVDGNSLNTTTIVIKSKDNSSDSNSVNAINNTITNITCNNNNNSGNGNNAPNFNGPRNWNPLHMHRFRPMLESILESSNDMYLRSDYPQPHPLPIPIYENWDLGQSQDQMERLHNPNLNQNQCVIPHTDNNNFVLTSNTNEYPSHQQDPYPYQYQSFRQDPSEPSDPNHPMNLNGRKTWTNTFMQLHELSHNSPTDNNNYCYYANSHSDSSSCSEYETGNLAVNQVQSQSQRQHQRLSSAAATEPIDMDGRNRAPSRRHSSSHHHHSHYYYNHNRQGGCEGVGVSGLEGPSSGGEGRKLTLDDYRKLGAIPKNFDAYNSNRNGNPGDDNLINLSGGSSGSGGSGSSSRDRDRDLNDRDRNHRRHSSYGHASTSRDEFKTLEDGDRSNVSDYSNFGDSTNTNTLAVNKLLRKLECAIAKGEHRLAATLAHDLALLKVNCVVAKGGQNPPPLPQPIIIRVYVEDRFMQQGPFQVQVTSQMTVQELKNKIETDWSIPSAFQKWILGRKIAEEDAVLLSDFDVVHDSMAFLYLVTPQIERPSEMGRSESGPTVPVNTNLNNNLSNGSPSLNKKSNQSKTNAKQSQQQQPLSPPSSRSNHQKSKASEPSRSGIGGIQAQKTGVVNVSREKMESKANITDQQLKSKKTIMQVDKIPVPMSIPQNQPSTATYTNVIVDSKTNVIPASPKSQVTTTLKQSTPIPKDEIKTEKLSNGFNVLQTQSPIEKLSNVSATPLKDVVSLPGQLGGNGEKQINKGSIIQSQSSEKIINKLPPKIPETLVVATSLSVTVVDKPSTHKQSQESSAAKAKTSTATSTTDSLKKSSSLVSPKANVKPKPTGSASATKTIPEAAAVSKVTGNQIQSITTKAVEPNQIIGAEPPKANHRHESEVQKDGKFLVNELPQQGVKAKPQTLPTVTKVPQKIIEAATNKLVSSSTTPKDTVIEPIVLKNNNEVKITTTSHPINGKVDRFVKPTATGNETSASTKLVKTPNTVITTTATTASIINTSKPPVSISAPASESSNKSEPNWNPEPVPQRRTKNVKKNLEDFPSPPSSSASSTKSDSPTLGAKQQQQQQPAVVPQNNDSNIKIINTVSNSKTDLQTNLGQPAKIAKSPSPPSPIEEPVYQNNYPIQKPSPVVTKVESPVVPAVAATIIAANENVPPPIPEKKPQWKKENVGPSTTSTSTTTASSSQKLNLGDKPTNSNVQHRSPSPLLSYMTFQQDQKSNNAAKKELEMQMKQSEITKDLPVAATSEMKPVEENIASNAATQAEPEQAAGLTPASEKEDNVQTYLRMLRLMEQSDLISNSEELECPVCFSTVKVNEGVVLRDCLHSFCRECLIGSVQYADEPEVKCPFRDDKYSCNSVVQEREIKALVPPELFERHLARSVKVAEHKIVNTFHCKTADCTGWCVFEDDVNVFNCPVCKKRNCLTCQAIHEGVDCQQYQRQLAIDSETDENAKSSRLMLEKMIQRGEALECPACHVVLLKKWGCDWVRCSYCKTEICWITKGFRWGPNGKGDTSGGCKCGVNGVRCHPKCTYCH